MDGLKALLQAKRGETAALRDNASGGDSTAKKYMRRGEVEEARLKRLREQEIADRAAKEQKRGRLDGDSGVASASGGSGEGTAGQPASAADGAAAGAAGTGSRPVTPSDGGLAGSAALSRDEAVRRLRALGQPATLLGEADACLLYTSPSPLD